jgi:acyl-CoA thioesterase-1
MKIGFRVIAMLIGLSACGRGQSAPAHASVRESADTPVARPTVAKRRVLFVGTSLTAGYGLEPDQAYPALIARRIDSLGLNYEVVNAGVSGETSAGALRRIDWLLRAPVDVFVLETGANDGLRALSVDSMRANIQVILDKVRATHPAARVILVGMEAPPNLGPRYTSAFHAVFPELARKNGAVLVPFLLADVAGVDSLNQADGIHPNARGAQIVADRVWRALRPLIDGRGSA